LLGFDSPQKLDIISVQAEQRQSNHQKIREAIMRCARGPNWKPEDDDAELTGPNGSDQNH
jgi:hypothetical protein